MSDYLINKTYKTNLAVMYSLHSLHLVIGIAKLVWKKHDKETQKGINIVHYAVWKGGKCISPKSRVEVFGSKASFALVRLFRMYHNLFIAWNPGK